MDNKNYSEENLHKKKLSKKLGEALFLRMGGICEISDYLFQVYGKNLLVNGIYNHKNKLKVDTKQKLLWFLCLFCTAAVSQRPAQGTVPSQVTTHL
jgi:hypothetical protein